LSTFLSGLTTFGVPEAFGGGERLINQTREPADLCITRWKSSREQADHRRHTFEALVETPGPLEELVEVRPAVEHPLEGVVVGKLQQREIPVSLTALSRIQILEKLG
jgi:hypothetical protein